VSDRTPTFADLCNAIADGSIVATLDGSMYEVRVFDIRRYLDRVHSQQTLSGSDTQASLPGNDLRNWFASVRSFVA